LTKPTTIYWAVIAILLIVDIYFEVLGKFPTANSEVVQAQYISMSAEERADFLAWLLTADMRRYIAEDFCATNENTKRVCFNASKR